MCYNYSDILCNIKVKRVYVMFWTSLMIVLFVMTASFLVGSLPACFISGKHGAGFKIVSGFLIILVLYQAVYMFVGIFNTRVDIIIWIWLMLIVMACAASAVLNFADARCRISDAAADFSIYDVRNKFGWQHVLFAAVITIQIICIINLYVPDVTSDEYFLAAAVQQYETNDMKVDTPYTGSSYDMPKNLSGNGYVAMIAGISALLNIHPAVFVHIPWAVLIVLMAYIAQAVIAALLLDDKKDISLFLSFLTILGMFSAYSKDSLGFLVYAAIWQGKAVFALVAAPALICYTIMAVDRGKKLRLYGGRNNWFYAVSAAAASIMLTSMGAFFAPVLVLCVSAYYLIHDKNIKNMLYCLICFIPSILYVMAYFL